MYLDPSKKGVRQIYLVRFCDFIDLTTSGEISTASSSSYVVPAESMGEKSIDGRILLFSRVLVNRLLAADAHNFWGSQFLPIILSSYG